ncbi:MAG: DoxX family protein [Myxococcales bacterium]|nr:DoxX family protein [Myxococcales bacterium]
MAAFMRPFAPQAYAAMRIVTGFLFLWHGAQKVLGIPVAIPEGMMPAAIQWTAGPIELVGGALVMIGFLTSWAAFLCSGTMAVAYWIAHGTQSVLPLTNGGEPAALYCFVFLYIAAHGSGIWSVDGVRDGSRG